MSKFPNSFKSPPGVFKLKLKQLCKIKILQVRIGFVLLQNQFVLVNVRKESHCLILDHLLV